MNATEIKKIAIIAMTIDHIAWILPNEMLCSYIMHVIGRITAPIMWFFIAGGFNYGVLVPVSEISICLEEWGEQ